MKIKVYTDGACRGNQFKENLGAWAYKINFESTLYNSIEKAEVVENTTNNRMELTAVINALKTLGEIWNKVGWHYNNKVIVYSDSTYVIMGLTSWYKGWIKKNWKDVKNAELWKQLISLKDKFADIKFQHIPGHSGDKYNEYVDALCNEAMDKHLKNQLKKLK